MSKSTIPFETIKWDAIPRTEHRGVSGTAWWQTIKFCGLRLRMVEYSAGYRSDHWCRKGHLVHCLNGEFVSEQENGEASVIKKGMSYVVSDGLSSHRSVTANGVKLLIIDGVFLSAE